MFQNFLEVFEKSDEQRESAVNARVQAARTGIRVHGEMCVSYLRADNLCVGLFVGRLIFAR